MQPLSQPTYPLIFQVVGGRAGGGGIGGGVLSDVVRLFTKKWENCCSRFFVSSPFFGKNIDKRGVVGKRSMAFCSYCEGLDGRVYIIYEKSQTPPG